MPYSERLKKLREGRNFNSQKAFVAHANKYGYDIALRRYGAIERGDAKPTIDEICAICAAMKISADAWLFGVDSRADVSGLSQEEIAIVSRLIEGLLSLRG